MGLVCLLGCMACCLEALGGRCAGSFAPRKVAEWEVGMMTSEPALPRMTASLRTVAHSVAVGMVTFAVREVVHSARADFDRKPVVAGVERTLSLAVLNVRRLVQLEWGQVGRQHEVR